MESAEQERRQFAKVAAVLGSSEEEITSPGILSLDTIQEVTIYNNNNNIAFFPKQVGVG